MISLNIVVFHVVGDERINVVVLLVHKKSGYDSEASFSFLTLITSPTTLQEDAVLLRH
jgi:hypothetical protein